ncbi:hypothetical protein VTJ04DRAFT_3315 [Mycothermus thermophilus]|uniref:uncharacterized protein n=1 Tax=Humicola insolens TaxID=85995 RepID=UPI003742C585
MTRKRETPRLMNASWECGCSRATHRTGQGSREITNNLSRFFLPSLTYLASLSMAFWVLPETTLSPLISLNIHAYIHTYFGTLMLMTFPTFHEAYSFPSFIPRHID